MKSPFKLKKKMLTIQKFLIQLPFPSLIIPCNELDQFHRQKQF